MSTRVRRRPLTKITLTLKESLEPSCSQCSQQAIRIAKMVGRCCVTNLRALSDATQRKPLNTEFIEFIFGSIEKRQ
jgi:hypothetical protein